MNPATRDWLLSEQGAEAIASAADAATPAGVARLRRQIGGTDAAERAAAATELAALRRRAAVKFSRSAEMYFTAKALEQATDEAIARYKGQRFANGPARIDVGCAAGGDLIAMAAAGGRAVGYEADATLAAFAGRNAEVHGVEASVHAERFTEPPAGAAWHADPDRRVGERRGVRPEAHEPSLSALAAWRQLAPDSGVKFAPAACLPEAWQQECELEWISRAGECRQLVAWGGGLARQAGRRGATRVVSGIGDAAPVAASFVGEADRSLDVASDLRESLYEPDSAVLAAGLTGALGAARGLSAAAAGVPYLTGGQGRGDSLLAEFCVREIMPLDRKRLAAWLAERHIGRLEIKCRGVDVRPEELRKQLRPRGDAAATLLIWPTAGRRVWVAITDRVRDPAGQ